MSGDEAIPRDQLRDWQGALQCLMQVVTDMKASISTVQATTGRPDLLKATKAIRLILDDTSNGANAIAYFRERDNDLGIITVLTYAARSDDAEVRINATLILGNVIDNSSVCVPIDHLYDPRISINGRANLLAIVAGPVSYAYIENVRNIERVADSFSSLPDNLQDTKRLVDNLKKTNDDRKKKLGDSAPSAPPVLLAACSKYQPIWANDRLNYRS